MYLEYPLHQQDLNSITILDQCYRHPKEALHSPSRFYAACVHINELPSGIPASELNRPWDSAHHACIPPVSTQSGKGWLKRVQLLDWSSSLQT